MTTDSRPVDDLARDVFAGFELRNGRPQITEERLAGFVQEIAALGEERRTRVAEDLLLMARRVWSTDEDGWDDALLQLCLLLTIALGDVAPVGDALVAAGVDEKRARALVGAASELAPVGAVGRPAGALSPLGARIESTSSGPPPGGKLPRS